MDREVEQLHGRVKDAVQHEERIKGQLRELEDEIQKWDQAEDDALRANTQDEARVVYWY